ncbi:MAG: hypothetical protein P8164_01415 [Gammaproteobacteria bacterium]|jgi:hypothetical protein
MTDYSEIILGQHQEPIDLADSEAQRSAAVALALQARRSVDIFTRDLDRKIYDYRKFLDGLQNLAVNHRGLIRILVKDSGNAVKYGHRLIALSQRLTSFIEIRKVAEDYKEFNEAFLIADETGYVHRKHADRFEGVARFNAAKEAANLLIFFNEVWRNSEPDADLRRIYL